MPDTGLAQAYGILAGKSIINFTGGTNTIQVLASGNGYAETYGIFAFSDSSLEINDIVVEDENISDLLDYVSISGGTYDEGYKIRWDTHGYVDWDV
jgi:hypothetical protein